MLILTLFKHVYSFITCAAASLIFIRLDIKWFWLWWFSSAGARAAPRRARARARARARVMRRFYGFCHTCDFSLTRICLPLAMMLCCAIHLLATSIWSCATWLTASLSRAALRACVTHLFTSTWPLRVRVTHLLARCIWSCATWHCANWHENALGAVTPHPLLLMADMRWMMNY